MITLIKGALVVTITNYDTAILYLSMGYTVNGNPVDTKEIIDYTFGKTFSQNIRM